MAKFCGNCGAQMDDAAKVCGNCGTPFAGAAPVHYDDPEKKALQQQKRKAAVKKYGVIGALILVVIIAISIISANTGSNGMLKKVMRAYKEYDIEQIVLLSSDAFYYAAPDYVEVYFENTVGFYHDMFEDSVGPKYKISYEVIDTFKISKRNMDELEDRLKNMFPDFDVSEIDKAVTAVVEVTAKQGGKRSTYCVNITMTKENGDWKVLFID